VPQAAGETWCFSAKRCPTTDTPSAPPEQCGAGVARLRSARVLRRASAARVVLHMPTRGEAHGNGEAALRVASRRALAPGSVRILKAFREPPAVGS